MLFNGGISGDALVPLLLIGGLIALLVRYEARKDRVDTLTGSGCGGCLIVALVLFMVLVVLGSAVDR
ncbi:hypothetical protein ACPEIF_34175 [Streptomyces sp. NPDC012600]|uniref:DUF4190 domain-containing protein n=1 Tax=Streptomyces stephensoniae TaxID=3375367 RepID=A0ABU2W312_9ACTN|nr:hypothetical protein [Streptomyces griseus]MDT0492251.1 hypothetical protein [Streptomyces griseus]